MWDFEGVCIIPNNDIGHLQFADDTILFINDDSKSIMGIKMIMKMFETSSGLKINFHKSSLYGPDNKIVHRIFGPHF